MKQNLNNTHKLNQSLRLSMSMKKSLDILRMSQVDLLDCIQEIVDHNPMIMYTPSTDMQQFLSETAATEVTLKDELYLQLHTTKQTYCKQVAEYIIESLDDHGFFILDFKVIVKHTFCTIEQVEETLTLIQGFEPVGVAARNSIDAIAIQLHKQHLYDAEYIFLHEQEAIMSKDYRSIAKRMNITTEEVMAYMEDIRNCNPFPCSEYLSKQDSLILPEFEIKIIDKNIELIPKQIGYISLVNELEILKNNSVLKPYFDQAYYFIDSITKRNKTLLLMANALIQMQRNYFLFHDELNSCTLADIAENCGFHESTVSRTLSNKYYLFHGEVYSLKSLFVSATKDGSSKDSILKAIQKLINLENKENPYADFKLVEKLRELDLYVSRRAIAKYRIQLNIPSSKERKKLRNDILHKIK